MVIYQDFVELFAFIHRYNSVLKVRKFDSIEAQNEWLMHWESRWAALRIHGRAMRQVEEMFQEEKPYRNELPLIPFRCFQQKTRTVYHDRTLQVGTPTMRPALLR